MMKLIPYKKFSPDEGAFVLSTSNLEKTLNLCYDITKQPKAEENNEKQETHGI